MAVTDQGFCHYCRTTQGVHELSEEAAAIIAENAQCNEDYYIMDDHINPRTGLKCEGVGKSPESLIMGERDEGSDHDDPSDEDEFEDDGDTVTIVGQTSTKISS